MSYALGEGTGPLRGLRVVEVASIGPGPHACMIMADLGADVIRLERPGSTALVGGKHDLLARSRPSVAMDLKHPKSVTTVLDLVKQADVLVEGMRPGVMERLGLGPEECRSRNPRLVYGRMTGWGQQGPLARAAGHDINYIGIAGALHGLGQDPDRPHFPSNLLGDFGGGSTYLVIGVLAAVLEARVSGTGQVVDAAIVDGTAHLNALGAMLLASGRADERRAGSRLDGGAPYYNIYETADGKHVSVGALEPQFYDELLRLLDLELPDRDNPANFPLIRAAFTARFKERTQAEWGRIFEGTDACVGPILPVSDAARHPHLMARGTFVERSGVVQPAPAPRFSRTEPSISQSPSEPGPEWRAALAAWGIADVDALLASGAVIPADGSSAARGRGTWRFDHTQS